MKSKPGRRNPTLKKSKRRFTPFGTTSNLTCLGRSKVKIKVAAGANIRSMVYVIRGMKESLMGRLDAKRLRLVLIKEEGAAEEQVYRVDPTD